MLIYEHFLISANTGIIISSLLRSVCMPDTVRSFIESLLD